MKLALITLAVFYSCILIGIVYQYALLHTSLFNRIRLRNHPASLTRVHQHMKLVTLNLAILAVFTFIPLYLFSDFFIIAVPTVGTFIVQFILYIVLDDLGFYTWHRTLHENQFLLRKIHMIHHRVRYPAPLEFIYVHPIEWMVGTIGIVVGVLLIIQIYGQANAYALWAYSVFRTLHELDIHSSTRSIIFRHVPFFGRVKHHDIHHLRAVGNYASTFTYLDKLFGTETKTLLRKRREIKLEN